MTRETSSKAIRAFEEDGSWLMSDGPEFRAKAGTAIAANRAVAAMPAKTA